MRRSTFMPVAAHKSVLLVMALVALIAVAHAAEKKPAADDRAGLQGEWRMVSGIADGFTMPDAMAHNFQRVCRDNVLTVTNGEQLVMKAKITLDPSKTPKTIDYEVIDGPTKGKTHLGIYELDGETFKSCFAAPGEDRPTDFTSKSGDRRTASEWKKTKKE
jgi:uncharacterized protein (TIGR03067 family)